VRKKLIIATCSIVAAVGLACGAPATTTAPGSEVAGPVATITVDGPGTAHITWSAGGNLNMRQQDNVQLPWTQPVGGGFYSIVAQRKGSDASGTISCTVTRADGSLVAPAVTSIGAFVLVTCSGSI
jgi:hypothetical protein